MAKKSKKNTDGEVKTSVFNDKKVNRWSQSFKNGDLTQEIEVEELDNGGYLVALSRYGYAASDKKKDKYISDHRKVYSEINPLDKDESDNPISQIADMISRNKQ